MIADNTLRQLNFSQIIGTFANMLQIHITGIEQPVERRILALYENTSDVRGDDGYAKQDKAGEEEHQGNYRCPARDGAFKNKMVD